MEVSPKRPTCGFEAALAVNLPGDGAGAVEGGVEGQGLLWAGMPCGTGVASGVNNFVGPSLFLSFPISALLGEWLLT
jgi:hypothetical protein